MKKEQMFIDVWVVSGFNAFGVSHYNNLHTNFDKANSNFIEIVNDAIKFASEEMSDFIVRRNANKLTIYDVEDDRVVIVCEISKQSIQCGTMYM